MVWKIDAPQGYESAKIKWELVPYTRGFGVDLGCGPYKPFPHFIGVDSRIDTKLFGIPMDPDMTVETCERLPMFADGCMDFVFSSHLLEHIKDHKGALKEWWRLLKVGGHLVLYLPHKNLYPNIGQEGANPDHKHDFLPDDIISAVGELGGFDLLRNEDRNEDLEYSFFQVYRKRGDVVQTYPCRDPKPTAQTVGLVRYGAFGDLIQASSVIAALKEKGFHITLYTTPRGWSVVEHDPNIDAVILQDTDQVPNHELGEFWTHEKKKYDRWINLSESVEGTWLALPGRTNAGWSHEARAKYLNANYFEFAHALAGVSDAPIRPKFCATEEEREWARKERESFGGDRLVMYVLAGSSIHKVWPHMDALFGRFMVLYPDTRIVTVGDEISQVIERGWEEEPRVIRRAGKYSIRQTLALLEFCDMVIGPETGVLNAAGHMPMTKIVFLSHSSKENLTKHWRNTAALGPDGVDCWPCHRMHYNWDHCRKHEETGTAMCQYNIGIEKAWQAVTRAFGKLRKAA